MAAVEQSQVEQKPDSDKLQNLNPDTESNLNKDFGKKKIQSSIHNLFLECSDKLLDEFASQGRSHTLVRLEQVAV